MISCASPQPRTHTPLQRDTSRLFSRLFGPLLLVRDGLADVETQTTCVQVDLVRRLLQYLGNALRVLELPQINVGPRLLDGVTNQLGGTGLTLGAHNGGLLLLAGFVDDESGTLRFLLCDLLGLDGSGELGGEGKVLDFVSCLLHGC